MDLQQFGRVIWRFKLLVVVGFILAVSLAVLSTARVSLNGGKPTFAYRNPELWQSQTSLLITMPGFPWGRAAVAGAATGAAAAGQSNGASYLDAGALANLTTLYTRLATSDQVTSRLRLPIGESVAAQPTVDESNHILPIVGIIGIGPTAGAAASVSIKAARTFQIYIAQQQQSAAIPENQRVSLEVINRISRPQLLVSRKKTVPLMAFLLVMIVTIGSALALENLRPRVRPAAKSELAHDSELLQQTA